MEQNTDKLDLIKMKNWKTFIHAEVSLREKGMPQSERRYLQYTYPTKDLYLDNPVKKWTEDLNSCFWKEDYLNS